MIKKKLIIGTANFKNKYGIGNSRVGISSIKKILKYTKEKKLNYFDTSEKYKDIISDMPENSMVNIKFFFNKKWENFDYALKQLKNIKKKNKKLNINSIMFHDTKILFSIMGSLIFKNLLILKKKKLFKKIGVSIYDYRELSFLLKNFKIDIVQCPFSILDRRLVISGWLRKLSIKKIEVHARSVFFQGLLVNDKLFTNKYFHKWHSKFSRWFKYLKMNGIKPVDVCLSYVLKHNIDKVVLGVDDINHLISLINFKKEKKLKKFSYMKCNNNLLIDTRKWTHIWKNE